MPRVGFAAEIDVGGRSPKTGDCLEQVRASRRLGLTHSLDSPRAPESEPAKSDLPGRESPTGELPRPRSASPKRNPAPPSVKGSTLSAKIQRATTMRAKSPPPVQPPPPPPPRTRARFSVKLCEEGSEGDADAQPASEQDSKVTTTSPNITVETDTTPLVVLPLAVAAETSSTETPPQEKESTGARDQGRAVGGHGDEAREGVEPRSPGSVIGIAASVFGIEGSQIQRSESPSVPARHATYSNTTIEKQLSSSSPARSDASWISPSSSSPPPRSPPLMSPGGMPAAFSAASIRRSRPGAFGKIAPSPAGTNDEGAQRQPKHPSSWSSRKPPPLLHTTASILPIPPPETPPTDGVLRPTQVPPPPILKLSMTRDASSSSLEGNVSLVSSRPPSADATSSSSSSPPPPRPAERSESASPTRTPQSSPGESDHRDQKQEHERQRQQQQQQPLRSWSSMFGVGGKGKDDGGVNSAVGGEQSMESDLDFIRELTQYRSTALRKTRQNEYEFALVLKPNDEYRDAVEVLELALDLRDGASEGKAKTTSPQKLDNARRIRESLDAFRKPSSRDLGVSESSQGIPGSQSGGIGVRKAASPPQVRPGLSEGLEGGGGGSRRQRLSLLDDLQEEEGVLTNRRRKELERKKKHRLVLFVDNMREGVIVRRHLAHHTCEQIVLQSTDDCRTITWKPLLAANGGASNGGGGILGKLGKRGRVSRRAESIMAEHIAHVLPATDPDPSHAGFFGTRALRLSEDIANPARTFSLLYGDWGGARGVARAERLQAATGGGNGTLDVECDDDRTYALLFQGFLLLHMQTTPAAAPGTTPHVPPSGTPPKPGNGETARIPGLDNMEAGSGTKGFPRLWSARKLTSSRSSSALARIPSDRKKRSSEVAGEEASPPLGVAGTRGSLRKSLKFLPELLGGLSTSSVLSRRGSQQQQTASNIMGGAPPEFFLGWTSPGTQIWSRLRMAGLEVEKLYSLDRRRVLLKIRLPTSKLEEVAETMRLKLRRRDGTIGRFKKDHRSLFSQSADGDLFRSGESQKVIDHLVRAKIKDGGSELDNRTELGKHISKRMPLHNQARLEALYNAWVVYWRVPPTPTLQQNHQQQQQRVKAAVKVETSEEEEDEYLTRSERMREKAEEAREALVATARLSLVVLKGSMWQPLEMIADYFGEATAFYFAWMGFYTQGLVVPSIFGVIVFACQVHAGTLDHPMMTVYAVFVILWSSAFLVLWRQRCSELAYRWGVLNFEQEEQTRSQFWGKEQLDHVTGRFGREYPVWKRWATYAVTMPIMVGFTAAVLLLMFTVIVKRDSASGVDRGMEDPEFWGIMLVKPMLYGIAIPILYGLCKKLGVFLNDLENHKTENKYRNALIVKVFSFRFVTVFASLYHYAFLSREGSSNYKLLRLAASLCSFMTIGQWWYMVWMCYIPERVQNWKINKLKAKVEAERRKLEKAEADEAKGAGTGEAGEASRGVRRKLLDEAGDHLWEEALLKEYNLTDVFDDYTMSLIQFGYVALFSAAFPLAPLLAMINNLVQTRVDAHKICKTRRRPIALKSGGIGVWDNVLQLMTLIAVITNCALIGVTSTRWWPDDVSPATQILVVVIVEHVILFLKYWLESTVPRVPTKVQRALLRERMERDQKGALAKAGSGDRSKFETNFSRALADESSVSYGGGSGYVFKRTNNDTGASYSTPTKVITVDENLTATTPTASGRVRRVFSANLSGSGCSSGSTSRSTSPARSFASCTPPRGTSGALILTPEPDGADATSAMFQEQMLPPPSASTVRTGLNLYSSSSSTIPPLPPRRFGRDADSTQAS